MSLRSIREAPGWILSIGIVGVVGLATGVWFAVAWIASSTDVDVVRAGAVGDIFGAASALFAGLGTFFVVFVLWFELRHRTEEYRPFVTLRDPSAKVLEAGWKGPQFFLMLDTYFEVASVT